MQFSHCSRYESRVCRPDWIGPVGVPCLGVNIAFSCTAKNINIRPMQQKKHGVYLRTKFLHNAQIIYCRGQHRHCVPRSLIHIPTATLIWLLALPPYWPPLCMLVYNSPLITKQNKKAKLFTSYRGNAGPLYDVATCQCKYILPI